MVNAGNYEANDTIHSYGLHERNRRYIRVEVLGVVLSVHPGSTNQSTDSPCNVACKHKQNCNLRMVASVLALAHISASSTRKMFTLVPQSIVFRIKVSEKIFHTILKAKPLMVAGH